MANNYYIDLKKFTLEKYRHELEQAEILPSRKILKEKLQERFQCLEKYGIKNLQDLILVLKTTEKTKNFAKKSGLPEDYLLILRREVNSYQPKPLNLKDFPGTKKDAIEKLATIGIKNTKHLFEKVKTQKERNELVEQTGIATNELLELVKLTDLSRVKWIGPIFARIFLDTGTDTVEKLSKSIAENLFKKLVEINIEKGYTKGKFTVKDVQLCINIAKEVPKAIKY